MPPAPSPLDGPLRCIGCGRSPAEVTAAWRCRACGDLVEALAPPAAAPEAAAWPALWRDRKLSAAPADQSGVWRFRELLAIPGAEAPVTLREGNTPLYELPRAAAFAGLPRLLAKHQGMNPTGSFKDTGMTAAMTAARAAGFAWVACASTGNTSASMAAYAARAGLRSLVLAPAGKITLGKLAQALDYGALVCPLATGFDGCVRVLDELVARTPIYVVNSVNPYRLEGQKTVALELLEQLGWRPPDHIVVPGGNLGNSSALGKGLAELLARGLIQRLPRLSIIQAAGANPLVRSLREHGGRSLTPVEAETRATAIRIGNPASWKKAVAVLRETGGACEDVTEDEIAAAKAAIGADGIGCEPASAAALAGAAKLTRQGFIRPGESVVLVLTGHTLKDPEFVLERAPALPALEPAAAAVLRQMEGA